MAGAKPFVIDTDVDIDDWMAILYLLQHPDVDVRGITVVGTGAAHLEPGTRNALDLLQLAGQPDIPVAIGRSLPMRYKREFPAAIRESVDNLYGLELPTNPNSPNPDAIGFLADLLENSKRGEVSVVAIGPLTNLGALLDTRPELAEKIERIYIMGGALGVPGNVHDADPSIPNEVAEWNIFLDPVAADIVMASGAPITLVPLDATRCVPVTEEIYLRFLQHHQTPAADFIYRALFRDFDFLASGNFYFWDPLAAVLATDQGIGDYSEQLLDVNTSRNVATSGQINTAKHGHKVRVCHKVLAASFYDLLLGGLNKAPTYKREITFMLDDEMTTLQNVSPQTLLIDYLHSVDKGGTKLVCGEGGCGACTVMVTSWDAGQKKMIKRNVNSCLHPLCATDGMMVTTTQGIGSVAGEVDEVQNALAANNGSQCGYCSPGFVMSMFTLRQNQKNPSAQQVEDNFDGHICRCTGYRPILDGFQRLAARKESPGPPKICIDPAYQVTVRPYRKVEPPTDFLEYMKQPQPIKLSDGKYTYVRPLTLKEAVELRAANQADSKYLVGNTIVGIVKTRPRYDEEPLDPSVLIDITAVPELFRIKAAPDGVHIGGSVTIARMMEVFEETIKKRKGVETGGLRAFLDHLRVVANHQVRNVAGVGGNIWLAVNGGDDSDLLTVMGALGAEVNVVTPQHPSGRTMPLLDLPPDFDPKKPTRTLPAGAIYESFRIPYTHESERVRTYKARLREQNAFPLVNAAFKIGFHPTKCNVVASANIVINGIDADYDAKAAPFGLNPFVPTLPKKTEKYLVGRSWNQRTLRGALEILSAELQLAAPRPNLTIDGVPFAYRTGVALDFFYKMFVSIASEVAPGEVGAKAESAGEAYRRPLSSGTQTYNSYADEVPVSLPVIKLSAFLQATGEAKYSHDMAQPPETAEAAFVYSEILRGTYHYRLPVTSKFGRAGERVTAAALAEFLADRMDGFVSYVTYADIGEDQRALNWAGIGVDDPIFVPSEDDVVPDSILAKASSRKNKNFFPKELTCIGAPIGLVVATDRRTAYDIATYIRTTCIKFELASRNKIVTDLDEAIRRKQFFVQEPPSNPGLTHIPSITRPGSDATWLNSPGSDLDGHSDLRVVSGSQRNGFQNHFYLETMATLAVPGENGAITLHTSTQQLADNQNTAAGLLGLSLNQVRVIVRRDGGGFGGKQTRSRFNSSAAALAAHILDRPVRLVLDLNTNFIMCGERHPFRGDYRVAVDGHGKLRGVDLQLYSNGGSTYDVSFPVMDLAVSSIDNGYQVDTFRVQGEVAQTNRLSNTAFRSFGVVQAINIVETAVAHAAHAIGKRPEDLREASFYKNGHHEWTSFKVTRQTIAVMETYGFSKSQLAELASMKHAFYANQEKFEAALAEKPSLAGLPTATLRLLEDYSSTSYDFAPYLQPLQYCDVKDVWDNLKKSSDFETRAADIERFNNANRWRKRGISMIPLKYGVSYTGPRGTLDQGGAYVTAYAGGGFGDGSVLVQHGGVEIGQGIHTKMAQIAAETLGIPLEMIVMADTDTNVIADASPTAASTGSDLNGGAVRLACQELRTRLEDFCVDLEQYMVYYLQLDTVEMDQDKKLAVQAVVNNWRERWSEVWTQIVQLAYVNRINLSSEARYKTPHYSAVDIAHPFGSPFFYFTYAAAASEVEVDVLTGEWTILRTDILFDVGKSLNPLIDVGQIEGGFIQGVGYLTTEELLFQEPNEAPKNGYPEGAMLSYGTWLYKPPETKTIPIDFRVGLVDNTGKTVEHKGPRLDPTAVKSSKGIGEPPLVMANSVFFAIRQAVAAARCESGHPEWFDFSAPATVPKIQQACAVTRNDLKL